MRRQKPDLIVPIRDRRQHKRYLTLRNAAKVFAVLAIVFLAITIRSEMDPKHRETFGDLFQRELPPPVERKPVEVVQEAQPYVEDQTAPDPMLVAPMAREQWLGGNGTATASAAIEAVPIPAAAPSAGSESRVAIVGGPEGVSVVRETRRRPVLSGGFGR